MGIVITSPSKIEEELNLNKLVEDDEEFDEEKPYNPYDINEREFGKFIIEKVNEKTAHRLLQHLKQGSRRNNTDDYDDDTIKASQCIHVLLFACVLFLKYKEKTEKRPEIQIDKKKIKKIIN